MLILKVISPELPNLVDLFPLTEDNQFPQIIDILGNLNLSWTQMVQFELTGLDYKRNSERKLVFNPLRFPKPFSLYVENDVIASYDRIVDAFKEKTF